MTHILRILINLQVDISQWFIRQQMRMLCKKYPGCDRCPYEGGGFWSDCHLDKAFHELNMIFMCREDWEC